MPVSNRPRIAIAGASGFVGSHLRTALREDYEIVGLTRSAARAGEEEAGIQWRRCDLYSFRDTREALAGVDVAIYLVHSMLPSSRLTQATFEDLDWILADNFGRAAAASGVRHIIYLGGLIPKESGLSAHLRSRLEVERTLAAYGTPVTALRAGMVVGPGGSSMQMLVRLVRRLPLMLLPRWTASRTQPIALEDLVRAFQWVLEDRSLHGRVLDVGGPDVMTYREMMERTARVMGKRRHFIPVPVFTPGLSTLWVQLITGSSRALVRPLVESLRHEMVARDNPLVERLRATGSDFESSLRSALVADQQASEQESHRKRIHRRDGAILRKESRVRSIQRLRRPPGWSATEVAAHYFGWLDRLLRPLIRVRGDPGNEMVFSVGGRGFRLLVMKFSPELSTPDRRLYYLTGGWLVRPTGNRRARFEFRDTPHNPHTLCAIHDFLPTLPWMCYKWSQAKVHLIVMKAFRRHLRKQDTSLTR